MADTVCSGSGLPSILNIFDDAIFTVPQTAKKQVVLTTAPSQLAAPLCALEAVVPWLEVLTFLGVCADPRTPGRLAGRHLVAGEVACASDDDVCYVRASPYAEPCLSLPATGSWDEIDRAKLEFVGLAPATFQGIAGVPFEDHSGLLWWEGLFFAGPRTGRLWRYPTYLAAALGLAGCAGPLAENRAFQLLVSAALGAALFLALALIALWLLVGHLFRLGQQTAYGAFFVHSAVFLPPVALLAHRWLLGRLASFVGVMGHFWRRGSCFLDPAGLCGCTLCWAGTGKAYFACGALLGVAAELRCRFFLYPPHVYEDQGWSLAKCGQRHLGVGMGAAALGCVASLGSAWGDLNLLAAVAATPWVRREAHHLWLTQWHLRRHRSAHYANGGRRQTHEEYEGEGRATTERELAKLRAFVRAQHDRLMQQGGEGLSAAGQGNALQSASFDDETTRRLEAFRLGASDCRHRQERDEALLRGSGGGGGGGWGSGLLGRLQRALGQGLVTCAVLAVAAAALAHMG